MPDFLVLKTSGGGIPANGQVGSADVYLGTHADAQAATAAAASKWNLPASVALWAVATSSLSPFHTAVSVTVG